MGAWFFVDRLIEEAAEAAGVGRACARAMPVAKLLVARHGLRQPPPGASEALVNIALGLNSQAPNVRGDFQVIRERDYGHR